MEGTGCLKDSSFDCVVDVVYQIEKANFHPFEKIASRESCEDSSKKGGKKIFRFKLKQNYSQNKETLVNQNFSKAS